MNKYNVLVSLVLGLREDEYLDWSENYVNVYLRSVVGESEVNLTIRKDGKKYTTYIRNVEDTDIPSEQGKELFVALKEEWDRRQAERKREAWAQLGVLNG